MINEQQRGRIGARAGAERAARGATTGRRVCCPRWGVANVHDGAARGQRDAHQAIGAQRPVGDLVAVDGDAPGRVVEQANDKQRGRGERGGEAVVLERNELRRDFGGGSGCGRGINVGGNPVALVILLELAAVGGNGGVFVERVQKGTPVPASCTAASSSMMQPCTKAW